MKTCGALTHRQCCTDIQQLLRHSRKRGCFFMPNFTNVLKFL
nr:MAG TPA: hypothetical protein [Ackermannviridae sp.]